MAEILVVDDETISSMFFAVTLKGAGHIVNTAPSGEAALTLSETFSPRILISDWNLGGGIDGIELARKLREKIPELRVILFSGLPPEELTVRLKGMEITGMLGKPCDTEELLSMVARAAS